jgi:UDP-N-acetylmuramoyl-L-alanyl-D-glutamate--2,6-diaminopimelate ligase
MDLREIFPAAAAPLPRLDIEAITMDSREAAPHGLFLACRGAEHHGLEFLGEALERGVSAIAWESASGVQLPALPGNVVGIAVTDLRRQLGDIGNRFFGRPSERIAVVGITGTNGKTTVAWLLAQALRRLGRRAGYLGTLGYGLGTDMRADRLTTPDCLTVHRRLREFLDAGASLAVAEVSSHALDQGRVDGVRFRIAAFTNLTQDHLDYHTDMRSYGRAKQRLFTEARPEQAVINVGDAFGRELAAQPAGHQKLLKVAVAAASESSDDADLVARTVSSQRGSLALEFHYAGGIARVESSLTGAFNAENLVVAAGVLLCAGFSLDEAAAALGAAESPPGRMQRIEGSDHGPVVIVDFAHTPDAIRRVLQALRAASSGALWCVFGCGGNRDATKRSVMGAVAGELADHVIVTDDNPRDENPAEITAQIVAGIADKARLLVINDREQAIGEAIRSAAPGDVVLIAGKGHESFQLSSGARRPFSDQDVARRALESRGASRK